MKSKLLMIAVAILMITATVQAEQLSLEKQREIIDAFRYVTGRGGDIQSLSLSDDISIDRSRPLKCGTPAITDFILNYRNFDKDLLASFALDTTLDRPDLPDSLMSPSGLFMVHYATTGSDSVYQSSVVNGNGVPVFIVSVANILDSVYYYCVDTLGFPAPPSDWFYPKGGGPQFDVYIRDLQGSVFGQTWLDSMSFEGPGSTRATAFLELDNDYREIYIYSDRPLDAVRVTAAHEFFHAVQFGIDYTEAEDYGEAFNRRYWMEMSAVWMEEEQYDHINDYYYYLPYFYDKPWTSIQQFNSFIDLHPYGSVVFPIYLTERFGRDIIREIWERCDETIGPDFLRVTEAVVDSISGGEETITELFSEFALWNWFTGDRATVAPIGVGYSERAYYPAYPDSMTTIFTSYPNHLFAQKHSKNPHHLGAYYVQFKELSTIQYDTSFWDCNTYGFLLCSDSTEVPDPVAGYDFFHLDTTYWECNSGIYPNCTDSTLVPDPLSGYDFIHTDTSYWNCNAGTGEICIDSTEVADTTLGYDMRAIDSLFKVYNCFDLTYGQNWGFNVITRPEQAPDVYSVGRYTLPPGGARCDSIGIIDPRFFRSLTFSYTPASSNRLNYSSGLPIDVGVLTNEKGGVDSSYVDLPASVLLPYPNPAVVSEMDIDSVFFRFQVPTDSTGFPEDAVVEAAYLMVDIFTLAGEHVVAIATNDANPAEVNPGHGDIAFGWDMKNQAGAEVASGIYLAYARLYSAEKKGYLMAEDKAKFVIIR